MQSQRGIIIRRSTPGCPQCVHTNHESVTLVLTEVDGAGINQAVNRRSIAAKKARGFIKRQHDARRYTQPAPLFLDQTLRLHKRSFGFYPDFGSASHVGLAKLDFFDDDGQLLVNRLSLISVSGQLESPMTAGGAQYRATLM